MKLRPSEEAAPVARTTAGIDRDHDATFTASYQEHRPAMLRVVAGLLRGPDAEQIVHDVFLDHWSNPHRFHEERGSLRTFLMMRSRSRAIDALRADASRRRREGPDRSLALRLEVEHDGSREELRDALAALPIEECRPIVLAFFGNATYAEVARSLDLPEGTVKSRIRHGLRELRLLLDAETPVDATRTAR